MPLGRFNLPALNIYLDAMPALSDDYVQETFLVSNATYDALFESIGLSSS